LSLVQYRKLVAEKTPSVNPLRDNFEKERLAVSDFYSPFGQVNQRKTFRGCEFMGPGAIIFAGGTSLEPHFVSSDLVVIGPAEIFAAAVFVDCTFLDCKFINVTLLMDPQFALMIARQLRNSGQRVPAFLGLARSEWDDTFVGTGGD
jgi:hypothetical protein